MDKDMPKLGFGAMRLPYKGSESNIDLDHVKKMVDLFLDSGFKYFDTAYVYHNGKSEIALKDTLVKRHPRGSYWIATKMPMWSVRKAEDLDRIFNDQLKKLGVDYIDYYLLHAMDSGREDTAIKTKAYEFAERIKREGKARFVGFSFHDSADVLERILKDHPRVDFVQLQINYSDVKEGSAGKLYDLAIKHNKPIIIMEPVKGGSLAKLDKDAEAVLKAARPNDSMASWALRYCASLAGVYTTLSGMSNLQQVEDNIKTFKNFEPLTKAEEELIDRALRAGKGPAVPCTACRYCLETCPKDIAIPDVFAVYNQFKRSDDREAAVSAYEAIPEGRRAWDCITCGACVEHCPQGIKIPEELAEAAKIFA
ncbi:MAG: aldo/keto reductase [Clostridiales bacterium]|jgi:predicted aldo/keto reductase-like oxidoreductase|nr:aldo/keto reductase [Clostridiales bacterium]